MTAFILESWVLEDKFPFIIQFDLEIHFKLIIITNFKSVLESAKQV